MAMRNKTKEIRDVIGALDDAGLPVKEITRRLRAGQAGLKCGSIGIGERAVYEHRAAYRAEHGPPSDQEDDDATLDSLEALEWRILKRMTAEVAKLEQKRPGQLTKQDIDKLNKSHQTAVQMRNRIRGKGRPTKPQPGGNGNGSKEGAEGAMERLAREQRERES